MLRAAVLAVALVGLSTPVSSHDWYTGLKNEVGQVCCGGKDCAPLAEGDVIERPDGFLIRSRQVLVPFSRAHPSLEEDGLYHACFWDEQGKPYDPQPKCFFYPGKGY